MTDTIDTLPELRNKLAKELLWWNHIFTVRWPECSNGWHINCSTNEDFCNSDEEPEEKLTPLDPADANILAEKLLQSMTIGENKPSVVPSFTIQHRQSGYFLIVQPCDYDYAVEFDSTCMIDKRIVVPPANINEAEVYRQCLNTFDAILKYRHRCTVYVESGPNSSTGRAFNSVLNK